MDLTTQLRKGNMINFHGEPRPITAYEIYKLSEGACFDEYPITITEEWLLNLGLRKHIPSGKDDAIYYINHEGKTVLGYWLIDGAVNIGEFIPKNIK